MVVDEPESWWIFIPSFEEGTMRRSRKMERYLRNGAARGGQTLVVVDEAFDLPRRAELLR